MTASEVLTLVAALASAIVEFVKLASAPTLDPEAVRQALLKTQRIASDAIARHDGLIP